MSEPFEQRDTLADEVATAVVYSPRGRDAHMLAQCVPGARVVQCTEPQHVMSALEQCRAPVLVARPHDILGDVVTGVLARIHEMAPKLSIVVVVNATDARRDDIVLLTQLGIAEICVEDSPQFRDTLSRHAEAATFRARRRRCAAEATKDLPPALAMLVADAIIKGHMRRSVERFANDVGLPRRTLDNHLLQTGLTAERLLVWGRLIAAMLRVEASLGPVSGVASDYGWGAGSALHSELKRYTDLTCGEVRAAGGSAKLVTAMRARLGGRRQ